jgi:chemotaxis protein histidine kinase CheA
MTLIGDTLELIQGIKDVMVRLQQSPTDTAIANSIPSTAQAIKNMTNICGCKHVVSFLSVFESVLNRVRDGELRPKADLIVLLLICCDHVSRMASQLAHRDEIYLGGFEKEPWADSPVACLSWKQGRACYCHLMQSASIWERKYHEPQVHPTRGNRSCSDGHGEP